MTSRALMVFSLLLRGSLIITANIFATFMIAINRGPYWMDAGEWYAIWMLSIVVSINMFENK